ncbi:SCAN domain-containing protein 3-like [Octopus sinensis]|uniref:SCAN domain-containing protein 3-like n=1 Tax=Octopus sinensis TaxID=2607531 RepID=A0A7E6FGU6_9MOLL|nr:SCAN domain-containing protein 3-like [Octopus sinensis]
MPNLFLYPFFQASIETVQEEDNRDVRAIPLSNNTVYNRFDEMGQDFENQLIETLKSRKFSLLVDETTFQYTEAVLLTYVRYTEYEASLETTINAKDIQSTLKHYLDENKMPKENILSCMADGAPDMMGKKTGCLKMMKDENPNMLIVHCIIHQENSVVKKLSPVLNEIL